MSDIPVGSIAKCKFSFSSEHTTELGLDAGELVTVLEPSREGWTYCARVSSPSQKGCAPTDFLELVPSTASSSSQQQNQQPASPTPKPGPGAVISTPAGGRSSTSRTTPAGNNNPVGSSSSGFRSTNTNNNFSSNNNNTSGNAPPTADTSALMEGFHKNELYFQQLVAQREEANRVLDSSLREAATEIDLAKEKHSAMTRRLKELDHMVTKERKRWKDRVEEERLLLAQRSGTAVPQIADDQQQQQQQQQRQPGSSPVTGAYHAPAGGARGGLASGNYSANQYLRGIGFNK